MIHLSFCEYRVPILMHGHYRLIIQRNNPLSEVGVH